MEKEINLTQLIFVFSLLTFMLASIIVLFSMLYKRKLTEKDNELQLTMKNQELEILKTIVYTQENEREIIANNIHDDIGPLLTLLKLQLTQDRKNLSAKTLKEESLNNDIALIDTVITNIRSVSMDLSPNHVIKFGIYKALTHFAGLIQNSSGIRTNVESNFDANRLLDKHFSLNIYRICIELVNNIIKHANSKILNIRLELDDSEFKMHIEHNGKGLSHSEYLNLLDTSKGLGINSISSRVLLLDGIIKFDRNIELENSSILITTPYGEKNQNRISG